MVNQNINTPARMGMTKMLNTYGLRQMFLRRERGWTQDDLIKQVEARGVPLGQSTVSKIETTTFEPYGNVIRATAQALGTNPMFLLNMIEDSAPITDERLQGLEDKDVFISPEANEVGRLVDESDPEVRQFILQVAQTLHEWNRRQKEQETEMFELLTKVVNSVPEGEIRIQAKSLLRKIGR